MKNLTKLFVGMSLLGFALSSCSIQGPSGPQGEQGVPGENGKDGRDGIDGKDGTSVLTGNGEPSSTLGNDGDSYIDLDNWNYYVKEGGSWVNKGNIKGADGHDGQDGKDGEQGPKGEDGTDGQDGKDGVDGADGQDGKDGEQGPKGEDGKDGADGRSIVSIEKTSSEGNVDTYTISYSDGSTSTFTVTNGEDGSQGIQGEKGADGHTPMIVIGGNGNWFVDGVDTGIKAQGQKGDPGEDGEDGKDGSSVLTGEGTPENTLGKDGDSYIDLGTWDYYVKESGVWVKKGNIKGADVDVVYHTVTFDVNGGDGSYEPQTIKHGEKVSKPTDPSRIGYQFLNWSYQGEAWSFVGYPVTENMTLTANWSPNLYALSVASNDATKCAALVTSGSGYSGESITVAATPAEGCVFKGWYHNSTKVSKEATYSFTMPTHDYSLVARFLTLAEEEEERAIQYGTKPILSGDGKTLTYGLYPQTNVNDSTLVSALNGLTTPETNGWYLYDDVYYAKVSANPYTGTGTFGNKFDNGGTIVSGTTYWFKCEPITWNVLSSGGEYLVLSSVLLDAHRFHSSTADWKNGDETIHANNYKYSEIRNWLNDDFYDCAFALGDTNIQTTTLEDGIQDKAFLLRTSDYTDSSYGFASKTDRNCKATDWARARGAYCASEQYDGCYWTRTGMSGYDDMSRYVGYEVEEFLSGSVTSRYIATRPALTIQIA